MNTHPDANGIDRASSRTLSDQLYERLRTEVLTLAPGSRFHSDKALCRLYEVSLPVVRAALGALAAEHLIVRISSKGTFVAGNARRPEQGTGVVRRIVVQCTLHSTSPHADALRAIGRVLERADCEMLLQEIESAPMAVQAIEAMLPQLLANKDGLIVVSPTMLEDRAVYGRLESLARQVVFVNANFHRTSVSSLLADYETAMFGLARHLIDQGCRRIAFIGGPAGRDVCVQRRRGYEAALQSAGLPLDPDICLDGFGKMGFEDGVTAMRRLLERTAHPDAVMAVNDLTAQGAMAALRAAGLRIPADVAVTGFDNQDAALNEIPPLTTGELPYAELGRRAAELLLMQLHHRLVPGSRQFVDCPLHIRASSQRQEALAKPE